MRSPGPGRPVKAAVLVVDAAQGVEAQTLANTYLAIDAGLEVLPVVNKIDLRPADPQRVKHEIEDVIGLPAMDAPEISAKNGINIPAVLEDIVRGIPAPKGDRSAPLRALIFDSQYDAYRGVIVYLRVVDGTISTGQEVRMMASGATYRIVEVGYLHPKGMEATDALGAGEVGYFTASIKNVSDTKVGDTVTGVEQPAAEPLPGYRRGAAHGLFRHLPGRRRALSGPARRAGKAQTQRRQPLFLTRKLHSPGFGFRCGFLGLLHMEIIQERLEREFNLDLITTAPNVVYRITRTDGEVVLIDNPADFPSPAEIELGEEPYVKASVITPPE